LQQCPSPGDDSVHRNDGRYSFVSGRTKKTTHGRGKLEPSDSNIDDDPTDPENVDDRPTNPGTPDSLKVAGTKK